MRHRLLLAAVSTAAVAAAVLPAHAGGTPVLDGKKVKALTFSLASSPQDNDVNQVTDITDLVARSPVSRPSDYSTCPSTRCLTYKFLYKPGKGVKPGPFSVKISWTIPGQDYDLYVFEDGGDVGHCGASAGTSEVVDVNMPAKNKVYTVVVDEFRAAPDTITGKVAFPATDKVGSTAPNTADNAGLPVNCGLS
jgi:hypothetical protein